MGRNPQVWLKEGDVVEVGLEQVGTWYVASLSSAQNKHLLPTVRSTTNMII